MQIKCENCDKEVRKQEAFILMSGEGICKECQGEWPAHHKRCKECGTMLNKVFGAYVITPQLQYPTWMCHEHAGQYGGEMNPEGRRLLAGLQEAGMDPSQVVGMEMYQIRLALKARKEAVA